MRVIFILIISTVFFSLEAPAASLKKVPYFASIKASEANVRTGPSVKYPIRWSYQRLHWPIKIVATFEDWRKIHDLYGEAGWIHKSLLTTKRRVIINSEEVEEIYRLPLTNSAVVAFAEKGVIADLQSCKKQWCKIITDKKKGWIQQDKLWGVFDNEIIE